MNSPGLLTAEVHKLASGHLIPMQVRGHAFVFLKLASFKLEENQSNQMTLLYSSNLGERKRSDG